MRTFHTSASDGALLVVSSDAICKPDTSSWMIEDGEQAVIALWLGTFQTLCMKGGIKAMREKEIRDNKEKFNLGN